MPARRALKQRDRAPSSQQPVDVYRRAQSEAVVSVGFNPVAALMDKLVAEPEEARWLEVPEAALLLKAARVTRTGSSLCRARGSDSACT
jgi:hypothetical protein